MLLSVEGQYSTRNSSVANIFMAASGQTQVPFRRPPQGEGSIAALSHVWNVNLIVLVPRISSKCRAGRIAQGRALTRVHWT